MESKLSPPQGSQVGNQRNKDVEFICGENDSGERSRAIMALLFYFVVAVIPGNFFFRTHGLTYESQIGKICQWVKKPLFPAEKNLITRQEKFHQAFDSLTDNKIVNLSKLKSFNSKNNMTKFLTHPNYKHLQMTNLMQIDFCL